MRRKPRRPRARASLNPILMTGRDAKQAAGRMVSSGLDVRNSTVTKKASLGYPPAGPFDSRYQVGE
jgi:hypothetical protein